MVIDFSGHWKLVSLVLRFIIISLTKRSELTT